MDKDKEIEKLEYINTPFAYTSYHKGLTLLQQNIMVKVSAHLQHYLKEYFNNPVLMQSEEKPKPMFTDADKMNFPAIRLNLQELGVDSTHYDRVRDALNNLFSLTVEHEGVFEDGKRSMVILPIFSRQDIPVHEKKTTVRKRLNEDDEFLTEVEVYRTRGYVDLKINPLLLDDLFDMSQGYVTHPVQIAEIGKVTNMPMLYYMVRHRMQNFHTSTCNITVSDIREYLGTTVRNYKGETVKDVYPKYSVFKSRILMPALNDIKRLFDEGQINVYFKMTEVRLGKKKTGEPKHLRFDVQKSKPKPEPTLFEEAVAVEEPKKPELQAGVGEEQWQCLLAIYTGSQRELLNTFVGSLDGLPALTKAKDIDITEPELKQAYKEVYGKNFVIIKQV